MSITNLQPALFYFVHLNTKLADRDRIESTR